MITTQPTPQELCTIYDNVDPLLERLHGATPPELILSATLCTKGNLDNAITVRLMTIDEVAVKNKTTVAKR
jgi:hypothetical protein